MRRGLDCSHTWKALLSPDMRRSDGTGHSKGSRRLKLDGVPNALGWRLGRSNSAILPAAMRDEKRQWDLRHGRGDLRSPRDGREGVSCWPRRIPHATQACPPPRLRSLEPAKAAAVMFSVHKI